MTGLLTNVWWADVVSDYSITVFLVISFLITILNAWAKIHPEAESVLCLFKGWLYGFPGVREQALEKDKDARIAKIEKETLSSADQKKDDAEKK